VSEIKPKSQLFSGSPSGKRARKIKMDELVVFSRQLATMVEAGVPLVQSLNILGEQVENLNMQNVVLRLHDDVEGGKSLSEAMEIHKKVFSTLFVSMIKAGESSGNLEEILDRLATYIEKTNALRKKIKSALIYPCVVATMAFLITFGMLTWVIPQFASIFKSFKRSLADSNSNPPSGERSAASKYRVIFDRNRYCNRAFYSTYTHKERAALV